MESTDIGLTFGIIQYDRFSESAIGSTGITTEHLRSCQQLSVGSAMVPAKTWGARIGRTVEKMDLPSDVVAGLQGLLGFVEAKSGMVDDDIDGNPGKQERMISAVPGWSSGAGRDLMMCDEECGWCGECGDEYRP